MSKTEAKEFYKLLQEDEFANWRFAQKIINNEISATIGARWLKEPDILRMAQERRLCITKLYAAELFPDSDPPQLIIAENESETHEDLREKNPSSAPRISGEIFRLKGDLTCCFFQTDSILLHHHLISVPSEKKLPEIVDWLFNQNIIPVDANTYIISRETLSKIPK